MKSKPTFFNTRKDRLHWNYTDTNSLLFTILFAGGAELSFILRDLTKNDNIEIYIYKKLHTHFSNIIEIESAKISIVEYNLMKQLNIPSITQLC